jgi:hypothetical protein
MDMASLRANPGVAVLLAATASWLALRPDRWGGGALVVRGEAGIGRSALMHNRLKALEFVLGG